MPGIEKASVRALQKFVESHSATGIAEAAARKLAGLKEATSRTLEQAGRTADTRLAEPLVARTGTKLQRGAAVAFENLADVKDLQQALVGQLTPLLQKALPGKVHTQIADLVAHVRQELGATAPAVSAAEASQFLSGVLAEELQVQIGGKLQLATPQQRLSLAGQARALAKKLSASPQLDKKALMQNPPQELTDLLRTLNRFGVEDAAAINARLAKTPPPASIDEAVGQATGIKATTNNKARYLIDGAAAYAEMERVIGSAKSTIYLETYTWHDDETGKRMAQLLIDAKKRNPNLDIRVLYDSLGQNSYPPDRAKVNLAEMAKNGIKVLEFNRQMLGETGINLTHRKLLLVDGHLGMTGGMNIGDNYALHWHDTMVSLEGDCVQDLLRNFGRDWGKAGGQAIKVDPTPAGHFGSAKIRVAVTDPTLPGAANQLRQTYLAAIDAARPGQDIWLASPYFSDTDLVEHLLAAQQRGVQVNLILPHGNDMPLFADINGMMANRLLQAGAKGYLLDTGPKNINFSHVKLMTIGDDWAIMGSANNDIRSFAENQELSVTIKDRKLIADIRKRLIQVDSQRGAPMQPAAPPKNASLLELIKDFI